MPRQGEHEQEASSFGLLLRRFRVASGLSQDALAERAGLSPDTVSNLERGYSTTPQHQTVRLLADALALAAPMRAALEEAVVRRRGPPESHGSSVPAAGTPRPWALQASSRKGTAPGALVGVPNNLPLPLTRFLGREHEVDEVMRLLRAGRLVTLSGAGGIGKTRLALHVAAAVAGAHPDGVWVVELAPLTDPALVPRTVAAACAIREEPGYTAHEGLIEALRHERVLLVLDNCEHLLDACATLTQDVLQHCPFLRVLATSRQPLGTAGEIVWRVPSLPLPEDPARGALDDLVRNEAVALFIERAVEAWPDFTVNAEKALVVAQVCRRLDGIPLAIELAAAHVRVLTVEGISRRLDDRFHLLTHGSRTALPRHQTLRALVDWSYDLLTEPEKILLPRLSVFAGGWDIEAAEMVCAGGAIADEDVLDLLSGLVEKSLVLVEQRDLHEEGEPWEARYQLLETIRHYATERLRTAGEEAGVRARHLVWALDLAEQGERNSRGLRQRAWLDRLEREHDNLRAALAWASLGAERCEHGLRLAAALWRFWEMHGHLSEGLAWLERGLARIADGTVRPEPRLHGRLLNGACVLAGTLGLMQRLAEFQDENLARARALGDKTSLAEALLASRQDLGLESPATVEALALFRELGDRQGMADALCHLGWTYYGTDIDVAADLFQESVALYRELEDPGGLIQALNGLSHVVKEQGAYAGAEALMEEMLNLARTLGNTSGVAMALNALGEVAYERGDFEGAAALFQESLPLRRTLRDRYGLALTLHDLGHAARAQGDQARARQWYEEAIAVYRTMESPWRGAPCLVWAGCVALRLGDNAAAVRYLDEIRAITPDKDWAPRAVVWVAVWTALATTTLGTVAWRQGDLARAEALHEEALTLGQALTLQPAGMSHKVSRNACALILATWGDTVRAAGQVARAAALYWKGLRLGQEHGAAAGMAACLNGLGALASREGHPRRAARLYAAAARQAMGLWNEPETYVVIDRATHEQMLAAVRQTLGDDGFAAVWAEGQALTPAGVLDEAGTGHC